MAWDSARTAPLCRAQPARAMQTATRPTVNYYTPRPYPPPAEPDPRFSHAQYLIRAKVLNVKLFGAVYHCYDTAGNLLFYTRQKAFKLREDIRLYTGEDMRTELLTIQARQIMDFSAAYDVVDAQTGAKVGALRRKGWKSMLRDEWLVMDTADRELGTIREDEAGLALVRRFIGLAAVFIPQTFTADVGGQAVAKFQQNANPFGRKLWVDFGLDRDKRLDRRLGLAAAILLAAIEGRQQ